MRNFILFIFLLSNISILRAQKNETAFADSGTFLLHKFEQNIGKEKYTVSRMIAVLIIM